MDTTTALAGFAALAQDMRLSALRQLIEAGGEGLAAGDLARRLDARPNTLSANLAILSQAGLVRSQREGRFIRYFADMGRVGQLIAFLTDDCCGGHPESCLTRKDTE